MKLGYSVASNEKGTVMSVKAPSSVVQYVQVLHEHGVGSEQAEAFKKAHQGDVQFLRRAKGAERLFENKDEILAELDKEEVGRTEDSANVEEEVTC